MDLDWIPGGLCVLLLPRLLLLTPSTSGINRSVSMIRVCVLVCTLVGVVYMLVVQYLMLWALCLVAILVDIALFAREFVCNCSLGLSSVLYYCAQVGIWSYRCIQTTSITDRIAVGVVAIGLVVVLVDIARFRLVNSARDRSDLAVGINQEGNEETAPLTSEEIEGDDAPECPEANASLLSIITFWWMNGLISTGYKRQLQESDFCKLVEEESSYNISARFGTIFFKEMLKRILKEDVNDNKDEVKVEIEVKDESSSFVLVKSIAKAFGGTFMLSGIFKIIQDCLMFIGPVALKRLVEFVNDKEDEPIESGICIVLVLFFASCIQSICLHQYFQRCFRVGMRIRAALTLAVYEKALKLSSSSRGQKSIGDIVNLMSIDSQRIQDVFPYLHTVWSAPFQIAVSMYLLWQEVGISTLFSLLVMLLILPLNYFVSNFLKKKQENLMKLRDSRVKVTNEIFSNMKAIKFYSWEDSFQNKLKSIRDEELIMLKGYQLADSVLTLLWGSSTIIIAVTTFAAYSLLGNDLNAGKAFTALSLLNIMRFPVGMLPYIVNGLVESSVSIKRIHSFLSASEVVNESSDNNVLELQPKQVLKISNGNFSWDESGKTMALENLNIEIHQGELVAIIGSTGSGKTALLSAMLGELHKVSGTSCLKGSTAYTSQSPWIQNATVLENICFGNRFDKYWFQSVVKSCALVPDLIAFPGKQYTEIGEKGINLSGGQKHRVALARAVYQRADIYFMDDPLSAVDMHVSKHIFNECITGILQHSTRILVTQSLEILPYADKIIFLDKGRIKCIGKFDELSSQSKDFTDFVEKMKVNEAVETNISPRRALLEREISDKVEVGRIQSLDEWESLEDACNESKVDLNRLIDEEQRQSGKVSWSVYSEYIKYCGGKFYAFAFILLLSLWTSSDLMGSRWLAHWSEQKDSSYPATWFLGIYAGLALASVLWVYLSLTLFVTCTVSAAKVLHEKLLSALLRAKMSFFDTTPLGRILNRFSKDQYVIDESLTDTLYSYMRQVFAVLGIFIAICSVTPLFACVLIPLLFFYSKIQDYYVSSSRELRRLDSVLRSPIFSHFSETIDGVSIIRAFKSQARFIQTNQLKVDKSLRAYFLYISSNRWLALRLEFIGSIVVGAAAVFAVIGRHSIEPSLAGLSISYALMITQSLNWMVRMSSEREANIVSVERNVEYANVESEGQLIVPDNRPATEWPHSGTIAIDNLVMAYRPGLKPVINGLECIINPKEHIGIVGRTGAGKSSFFLAILRIVEPMKGSIRIDDIDISQIGLADLRSKISVIPQDPILFTGTVRFNLDPFSLYSDADIERVLALVHLKAYVDSLDKKLDFEVQEGGSNFSGGQKQLICLARALLRKSKILFMDEATSSVSRDIDNLIQKTISEEFRDCTVLTIAHRLETVMESDRIFVMSEGKIIESGNPLELLKDSESEFYKLAQSLKNASH